MRNLLVISMLVVVPVVGMGAPKVGNALDWSTDEGIKRLERSRAKADFFPLANQFESQTNKIFCGPTTGTIILNTFRLGNDQAVKPQDAAFVPKEDLAYMEKDFNPGFSRYTQNTFFNDSTNTVKPRAVVMGKPANDGAKPDFGFTLRQFHEALQKHGLNSEIRVVDDSLSPKQIRSELIANLGRKGDFVVVNYHHAPLEQNGGGHISPLGAYDKVSDSFLVMDVNPNNSPWFWVKTDKLIEAMKTKDGAENRGYLLVSERKL